MGVDIDIEGAVVVNGKLEPLNDIVWRDDLPADITLEIVQSAMDFLFWGSNAALSSEGDEQANIRFILSTDKQEERMAEAKFFGDFQELADGLIEWVKKNHLVSLGDDLFFEVIKSILDGMTCERGLYDTLVPPADNA